MTGFTESASHKSATAGSLPSWDGMIKSVTPERSLPATNAETMLITPSSTTGIWYNAPPIHTPTSPAISSPPTVISISKVSLLYKSYFSIALSITRIFFSSPLSFRPAPLPVTVTTSHLSMAAAIAALVVVFPIPISPVAIILQPSALQPRTISIPAAIASSVSALVMAGSFAKFLVPMRTFL